eukprot:1157471-Pelagomonas_calceolata.AAC.7
MDCCDRRKDDVDFPSGSHQDHSHQDHSDQHPIRNTPIRITSGKCWWESWAQRVLEEIIFGSTEILKLVPVQNKTGMEWRQALVTTQLVRVLPFLLMLAKGLCVCVSVQQQKGEQIFDGDKLRLPLLLPVGTDTQTKPMYLMAAVRGVSLQVPRLPYT